MLVLIHYLVISAYDRGISLTCIVIHYTIQPFPFFVFVLSPIYIPSTGQPPTPPTICPPISTHPSSIIPHPHPTYPSPHPNRSSAEPAPEVVSPRSESNSWTTLTDPSSETSRAPCESMTFWRFWSLSERLGEFFFFDHFFLSCRLALCLSVVEVGGGWLVVW